MCIRDRQITLLSPLAVKGLRLGVPTTIMLDGLAEEVAGAFSRALTTLSAAGAEIVEFDFAELARERDGSTRANFSAVEAYALHRERLQTAGDKFDRRVYMRLMAGAAMSAANHSAFDEAFGRLPEMMDLFVDRFGPYPFAAPFTVVLCPEPLEIPIEAQGLAMFGTNHLAALHHRLIPHELSHQWFGNSVTSSSWRDIWLHEGFACYAEWIWSEESGSSSADELARTHHERLSGLAQDLIVGDPGAADMFDDRVYKRGALAVHAVRGELGDDAFFALLRRWTATHRHGVVTSSQFEAMAAEAAGRSLDTLFTQWLRQRPLPPMS